MEKTKVLLLGDGMLKEEMFKAEHIAKRLKQFEEYGAEFYYGTDLCLLSDGNQRTEAVLRIEKNGPEWVKYTPELLGSLEDKDMIIVCYSGVSSEFVKAAKNCKFLGVLRSGVENINVPACTDAGITVSNSPGRVSEPVADFTVAMILAFNRNISRDDLSKRPGFRLDIPGEFKPLLIRDATIGMVGFGIIGKKVAKRLSGFGPKIIAYDPYANKADAQALGVELVSMEQVMSDSDFVSVHARLLPETEKLVGAKEIAMMKPTAVFINTARAGLVDEEALVKALQEKKIRGAALDVYNEEPLSEGNPLRKLDNVILTPHIAGGAGDTFTITIDIMAEELHRYFKGEKLLNKMN